MMPRASEVEEERAVPWWYVSASEDEGRVITPV
jgi:hypothetical protein